ncbi:MAG: zinc-ribbon domain-containing protein [Alphaproteobacteria bacterium]|nr:zinc-ribbon domain-containing protein [Alphaproteobacteria bacterium]
MILTCPSCDAHYKLDTAALRPEGQTVRCFKCKHTWTQDPSELKDEGAAADAGEDIGEDIHEDVGEDLGEDIGEDIHEDVGEDIGGEDIGGEDIGGEDIGEDIDEDLGEDLGEDIGEDDEPIDLEDFEPRPVDRETGEPIEAKPPSKIGKIVNWFLFFVIFGGVFGGAIVYRDTVRDIWPVSNRLYILVGLGVEAPGTGLELRGVNSKRGKKDGAPSLTISGEIANISRKVREVPLFSGELTNSAGEPLHSWTFSIRQKNLLPGESVPFTTEVVDLPKGAAGLNITFLDPEPEAMPETMPEEDAAEEMEEEATEEMEEEMMEDEGEMVEEEATEEMTEEMEEETMEETAEEEMMEDNTSSPDMPAEEPPEEEPTEE